MYDDIIVDDIIKIVEPLKKSRPLIDRATETVKHETKNKRLNLLAL